MTELRTTDTAVWLRAVLASTLDPVVVIDSSANVLLVSDSVERILGWKPDELIGKNINVLMPEPIRSEHDGYVQRFCETRQSIIMGKPREFEVVHRDGSLVSCEVSISPVRSPQSGEQYFCGIIRDITEAKEARLRLCRLNEALEAKNKEMEAFLYNSERLASMGKLAASVAHEIRNPLTAIKLRLFSIKKAISDNTRLKEKFQLVSDELNHLENVVLNFLEFSRSPALELRDVDVKTLLAKTLDLFNYRLKESEVRVSLDVEESVPPIGCDSDQMQQVLVNLLNNAVEAMPEGGTVTLSAARETIDSRPWVALKVHDDGVGVDPESVASLFEPFFSTKEEGTGLGLSISAQIVKSHGGELTYEAPANGGSCFAIRLPLSRDAINGKDSGR